MCVCVCVCVCMIYEQLVRKLPFYSSKGSSDCQLLNGFKFC